MPPKPGEHDGPPQSKLPKGFPSDWKADRNRFAKRYRTEVAASISSVFSTFAAVSTRQLKVLSATDYLWAVPLGFREDAHADLQVFKLHVLRSLYLSNGELRGILSRRHGTDGKHYLCTNNLLLGLPAFQVPIFQPDRAGIWYQPSHLCQYSWNLSYVRDSCLLWCCGSKRRSHHFTRSM